MNQKTMSHIRTICVEILGEVQQPSRPDAMRFARQSSQNLYSVLDQCLSDIAADVATEMRWERRYAKQTRLSATRRWPYGWESKANPTVTAWSDMVDISRGMRGAKDCAEIEARVQEISEILHEHYPDLWPEEHIEIVIGEESE